jgi:hypothetical protein
MTTLQTVSVKQLMAMIRLHQNIQKHTGPTHPHYERHGEDIRAMCAEMARRAKSGDADALNARL